MTDEDILEIERRANAATKGPWAEYCGTLKHYVASDGEYSDLRFSLQELDMHDGRDVPAHENANFIAHAREDVPALIQEIRRLQGLLKTVGEQVQTAKDFMDGLLT